MTDFLDEIVANARTENGPCVGCPATSESREDGRPGSVGVNPGLGHYDADVMFVTVEPSPSHGEALDWDAYDWADTTTATTGGSSTSGIRARPCAR